MRRPKAARSATVTAAAVALSVLGGVVAAAASAEQSTPPMYPAGTSGTRFTGLAFDVCDAPPRATMEAWRSSGFGAVGIYISGEQRACDQHNLTAGWVREVTRMGWKLLPLDVGLQSPCAGNPRLGPFSREVGEAGRQGGAAARGAVEAARSLGILPGSALYSDIEDYSRSDPGCSEAVRSYVSGWTGALRDAGYLSGVYGNTDSLTRDLSRSYGAADFARPDAVWAAQWDGTPTLEGWPGVAEGHWVNHQRVKQYRGDHTAGHGGRWLQIDANIVDAPVATVALRYPITGTGAVVARVRPEAEAEAAKIRTPGSTVKVICQSPTPSGVWDKLVDGSFLPDAWVDNGSAKPVLPTCATPFQVAGAAVQLRSEPSRAALIAGTLPRGSLAWVICETPGTTLDRPGYWQKLDTGHWISGPLLARPSAYGRSVAVPLCSG